MFGGDSLSSILGWISIACWIVVYSPQLLENYTLQSGEGLSILFVVIWLLGDITNLLGALLGGLLPTVIILALYYTTCDLTLLFQIFYYRWKRRHRATSALNSDHSERDPLLGDRDTEEGVIPIKILVLRYAAALVFIVAVGITAWWITKKNEDSDFAGHNSDNKKWWLVQSLGWSSAVLFSYITYFPLLTMKTVKNFQTRCEGLSPALFFFAIFGNMTYALSICAKSMDRDYLITNAGWLAGSTCTIFLDIFVLFQFSYYRYSDKIRARQEL
ncbi:PQ loop repeat-domain-containing protein [Crepidotus variabilis]|uniref:PQ loop repeat-domain-containing protein n=1 Tax=Crepidotus variabilis TaxID=179855 RepID=A0A9P6JV76_9AGAR|nr:PQ loop repeat-domain-containing protein [Crepidotus variabilis]